MARMYLGMHALAKSFGVSAWYSFELLAKLWLAKVVGATVARARHMMRYDGSCDIANSRQAVKSTVFKNVFGPNARLKYQRH